MALDLAQGVTVPPGTPTKTKSKVELDVPTTSLTLTGCASPDAFVTIFEDNKPIGTVTADTNGRFEKKIVTDKSGLLNIRAYFDDVNNRTSSTVSRNISLASQRNTVLDLLLPTTIEHEPEPVVVGQYLIFRGTTCPFALVNVTLNNNFTLAARADRRGNWYVIADTTNYFIGQHIYHAISSLGGTISSPSEKHQVKVIDPSRRSEGGNRDAELTVPRILDPPDGYLASTTDVVVSGIGPANSQIEIVIDGQVIGSVFTNSLGEWNFKLFMGANLHTVQARSCRDGTCSDLSESVRIYYNGDLRLCSMTFELQEYRFWGLRQNESIDLDLQFRTGTPPYEVQIDWGDAIVEHATLQDSEPIKLHHIYKDLGQFNGILTIRDDNGCIQAQYFSIDVSESARISSRWLLLLPGLLTGVGAIYATFGRRAFGFSRS